MASDTARRTRRALQKLELNSQYEFLEPVKKINEGDDVLFFLTSKAYTDIVAFLFQLNVAMFPLIDRESPGRTGAVRQWKLQDTSIELPETVQHLQKLLQVLNDIIEEAPPATGPRRFGNMSFRRWYELVEGRSSALLDELIPTNNVWLTNDKTASGAKSELRAYLLGSFGSAQRLDYGTGHELSFLAFLGCLWKLDCFGDKEPGVQERAIVVGVIEPYLQLIRRLIRTYNLEPAGSHGVWGLDDHFFLPYIFGSAQLSPAVCDTDNIPEEGSLPDAPDPVDVVKASVVERERKTNMYFSAIGFIYDMKKGPFWEHSPILYDISGVKAGWAKINKGLLKMYNAEVLSKFPVVQHFPFGSLFRWEHDPNAPPQSSVHTSSQPSPAATDGHSQQLSMRKAPQSGTKAPWAAGAPQASTAAPWASKTNTAQARPTSGASSAQSTFSQPSAMGPPMNIPIRAPWARADRTPRTSLASIPSSIQRGPTQKEPQQGN